jgi:hypothetical protein
MKDMKVILIGVAISFGVLIAGCETTGQSQSGGNQEAKRRAAIERQRQREPVDEAHANLWNAHNDTLDRDSNPLRAY